MSVCGFRHRKSMDKDPVPKQEFRFELSQGIRYRKNMDKNSVPGRSGYGQACGTDGSC